MDEQLVFVKWSEIEALFSPRHSKDKTSGRSWALLEQQDKMTTPEVKETSPDCQAQKHYLGV